MKARLTAPSRDELRAFLAKYEKLAALRDRRDADGAVAERGELKQLAHEFPGALRELDTLPRDEIERRKRALQASLDGAPVEPWMAWGVAYHAAMRAAFFVKARIAKRKTERSSKSGTAKSTESGATLSADIAERLAALAAEDSGFPVDAQFVMSIALPPKGRVNAAIFEWLGTEFELPAEMLWETLFPSRRKGRF